MKKTLTQTLLFIFLFSINGVVTAFPHSKPLPPLKVTISPVQTGEIRGGDIVDLRITVKSFIDAKELRIDIDISDGAELVSGETQWIGSVKKDEEINIPVTVKTPMKGKGKIRGRALIPVSEGSLFASESSFSLGNDMFKTKEVKPHKKKKDRQGRDVIEYRE